VDLAPVTGTTLTDGFLASGVTYTYTVRARDAASNQSDPSSPPLVVTTPDVVAPAPAPVLSTSAVSTTSISLSWTASSDNVGVVAYDVRRNGTLLGSPTGTTFTDSTVVAGQSYNYTVTARDAADNSTVSNTLPVTAENADPTLFSDSFSGANGAAWGAGWTTAVSNGTATQQSGTGELAFTDVTGAYARAQLTGLAARADSDTVFSFQFSSTAAIEYLTAFTRGSGAWQGGWRPTNGYGIEMRNNSGTIELIRNANGTQTTLATVTGAKAVSTAKQWLRLRVVGSTIQFKSWVDGTAEPAAWEATATDTQVTAPGQLHLSTIRGGSNVGAKNVRIDDLQVLPDEAPDTVAPSVPGNLQAPTVNVNQVGLTWNASTDNAGTPTYEVWRNGAFLANAPTNSYTDTTVSASTSYSYQVRAKDLASPPNFSSLSTALPVTTPAAGDTEDPSVPTGLQASNVTGNSATLTWNASTDNVAVTDYIVTRNGTDLAPVTGTTLVDGALSPGLTYSYTVRARDAAGNSSDPSSPAVQVTTPGDPTLFSDSFSGANGAAWGADWTTAVSNGTATQQAGTGELAFTDVTGAYARAQLTGLAARADSDTVFSFQFGSTTAIQYVTVFTRGSGAWQGGWRPTNGYGIEMRSNSGTIELIRNANGTQTTLATVTGAKAVSTAKQWLRLRVVGSTIQFKSWVDGTAEPAAWESTVTDTQVSAPGQLHLSTIRGGSNVGAKNVRIDDLQILPGV
jgi:chitodextrinase